MNYSNLFIFLSIGFFLSLFIGNIYLDNDFLILLLIITSLILLLILFFLKKGVFLLILFYIGYCIGTIFILYYNNLLINNQKNLSKFYGKNIEIIGTYDYLYSKDELNTKYVISLHQINNQKFNNIKFIVTIKNNYKINYGDIILINSKINEVNNYNNFNYKKFLLSKDIYFTINFYNELNIIDKKSNYIIEKIYLLKKYFLNIIFTSFPINEANFLAGVLFGYREEISNELKEAYNNTGLTHLIAVSGYNITILIIFLGFLLKYAPFYIRPFFIIPSIIFFVILVGSQPPVLRAGIMGIIGYVIITVGREINLLSTICLTGIIMLLKSPLSLNYDISFILSFLALFGILFFKDFYYKIFSKLTNKLAIKDSLVLTMSALTTTFPILFFGFGFFSIISPITNLLVGGLIPIIMLTGFLNIFFYLLSEKISFYFGYLPYFLLKFINETALFFSNLDFSTIKYDFGIYYNYYILFYLINIFFLIIYYKIKNINEGNLPQKCNK